MIPKTFVFLALALIDDFSLIYRFVKVGVGTTLLVLFLCYGFPWLKENPPVYKPPVRPSQAEIDAGGVAREALDVLKEKLGKLRAAGVVGETLEASSDAVLEELQWVADAGDWQTLEAAALKNHAERVKAAAAPAWGFRILVGLILGIVLLGGWSEFFTDMAEGVRAQRLHYED